MTSPFLAGQPRLLVLNLLKNYPTSMFSANGYQAAPGIDAEAEMQLFMELAEEDLIRPVVCESCKATHVGFPEGLERELLELDGPKLSDEARAQLAAQALFHLSSLNPRELPFEITRVAFPGWTSAKRLQSVVHLAISVKSRRIPLKDQRYTSDKLDLLAQFTKVGEANYRSWEGERWLRDQYLGIIAHEDERICIAVSGLIFE